MVQEIVTEDGEWSWGNLSWELPQIVSNTISAIPLQRFHAGSDKLTWRGSSLGKFSIAEAYNMAKGITTCAPLSWRWIWKVPTLPKIKYFIWQLCHNRIASKELLHNRNIVFDNLCPACNQMTEDVDHIFRKCGAAIRIRRAFSPHSSCISSFNMDVYHWLHQNCTDTTPSNLHQISWCIVFHFMLSTIWK